MGDDKTRWMSWVGNKNKPIRFWLRSGSISVARIVASVESALVLCRSIFSSPVRRTESYSDTPGVSVSVSVSVSVKMLKNFCLFVNSIPEKLDGFRRNLVGGLGMVQGSCH